MDGVAPGKRPNRGTQNSDWVVRQPVAGERPNRLQRGLEWDVDQVRGWPDRSVAAIATAQLGLITRDQLVDLGLGRGAIEHGLERGRLTSVHRGVYAAAHLALAPLAKQLAAVLACGEAAFLSHHSAAAVWGFEPSAQGETEVTMVGRDVARRREGIRVHRVVAIDRRDVCRHHNIPITSPARTLLGIAPDLTGRELERAFDDGLVRRVFTRQAVIPLLARSPRRPGAGRLADLASVRDRKTTVTRSEAEERFLALVRRARLPEPEVNVRIDRYVADFLWRDQRLIVEVDGYAFRSRRRAFERDHERDLVLTAAGFDVLRFTRRQLIEEPELVLARLVRALTTRGLTPAG
jgi:very-short-patch-repair endonuclease